MALTVGPEQGAGLVLADRLGERLRDAKSVNEIAQCAVDFANRLLGVDFTSLYVWDAPAGVLRLAAYHHQSHWAPQTVFNPGSGVFGTAFSTKQPLRLGNYADFAAKTPRGVRQGVVSALAVPVFDCQEVIAVMGVGGRVPDRFSEDDESALQQVAGELGPVLAAALRQGLIGTPAWRSMAAKPRR
jgi:GAF domain-containing protein